MSPLRAEVLRSDGWIQAFEIKPGEKPASLSNIKPDGSREIYLFTCEPDDSKSVISRSSFGVDRRIGPVREVISGNLETVRELKKGESFEMMIKTEKSRKPRRTRFTHF
jgi:hypothetical protein